MLEQVKKSHIHWTKRTKSVSIRFASVEQGTASHSCGWCYGLHVYKHLYVLRSMLWYMVTGCCWRITLCMCANYIDLVGVHKCVCVYVYVVRWAYLSLFLHLSLPLCTSTLTRANSNIIESKRTFESIHFHKAAEPVETRWVCTVSYGKYEWQWLSFSMLFSQHYRCDNCVFGDLVYMYIYLTPIQINAFCSRSLSPFVFYCKNFAHKIDLSPFFSLNLTLLQSRFFFSVLI